MTLVALRRIAHLNPPVPEFDAAPPDADVTFLPLEAVWPGSKLDTSRLRAKGDVSSGYTRFREGDILIPKITPTFQADRSTIARGLLNGFGCGTTELHVLRPSADLDVRYGDYLVSSLPFLQEGTAAMIGVAGQKRVPENFVLDFRVVLPTLSEQRATADFLDAETARIDALVEKRASMVVLIEEHAATLVDQTVWSTGAPQVPLYRLTPDSRPIMYGIVLPGPDVDEGVPIVKGGDIAAHRLDPRLLCRTSSEIEAPYARARLNPGDVLFAIRGSIGDAALVPESLRGANITQDVARVSPRVGVESRWLLHAVRSHRFFAQVDARATGATIRGVNIWDLKRAMIPLPPEREQRQLVDTVDRELDFADRTIAALERQIALLQERKQALITAAVTGQLDVTNGAA